LRNSTVRNPRLLALSAAALFSTGGTVIKFCSFTGWQVASLRCGIAAIAIALLVPETRRGWTWRALPVAGAYALQSLLFATSNKLTTAADAIFLQSTSPLYVLLLSPWLLGEKIRGRDVAFLAAIAAGLAMFFVGREPTSVTATNPVLGNVLAAGSGVGWALTVLGIRWLGRSEGDGDGVPSSALQATLLGNALACCIALPWALPLPAGNARDWAAIAFLGVFQIGLAYWCLTRAARSVRALELSLLLLVEPVLSAAWAWIFHGEHPGAWSVAGAATILAATAGQQIARRATEVTPAG
jgi:drug/metabolite transporter (DMT)-like permease